MTKAFLDATFNNAEGPSKLFAEIDVADRRFLHKKLQPEELRDYLLSNTKTEHIDIFSKQYHYTASDKNFTVKNLKEIAERKRNHFDIFEDF